MDHLPSPADIREFRQFLDANGYSEEALNARIGAASPPRADNERRLAYATREANTQNALVRLFLLGASLDETTAGDVLPDAFVDLCNRNGLLSIDQGRLKANVVIVCVADLLFASDAFRILGTDRAREFVLPASTHSANYLRHLTMRKPCESMLDLGCGCGIHALFAARHCENVVATDVSPAALRYTRFNATLNGIDNIECLEGDMFEPVAGRTFDLIVSNPPFVLGPDESFVYRDNKLDLDELGRELVRDAPNFLTERGCLQMLCDTVEVEQETWPERMKSWFDKSGCDAWLLRGTPVHPVHYVAQRASDVSGGDAGQATAFDPWVDYFSERDVTAIHPVMVAMRRRGGRNWLHIHHSAGTVDEDVGGAIEKSIAACDFLESVSDDEALLETTLAISADVSLEQKFTREDQVWVPRSSVMRLGSGLPMDAEVDMPVLAFLNQIDGQKSLQQILEAFGNAVGAEVDTLTADLLPIVRLMVGRGFLEPVEQ